MLGHGRLGLGFETIVYDLSRLVGDDVDLVWGDCGIDYDGVWG